MKDKKKIVIGALCALVMIMAVGYALLSQQLQITGQANITSNWQVEITDIKEVENIGSGRTISTNYTETTATFNNEVIHTGDKITYEITVTNKGTLDAVLKDYTINKGNNEAIIVTTDKDADDYRGIKLEKSGGTNIITVSVQYNQNTTVQPENTSNMISITLNYEQDLGQVVIYDTYSIGDVISFNNTNWRVIKDSTKDEDYVTIMKEKVLLHNELENYALSSTSGTEWDTTPYYWSSNCHASYIIGGVSYNGWEVNDCNYNYESSNIKRFLEGKYMQRIDPGSIKLKEVDGYKIRLMTYDELISNLGFETEIVGTNRNVKMTGRTPQWVYKNFGEGSNNVLSYWIIHSSMTNATRASTVTQSGYVHFDNDIIKSGSGVRPVINLYKQYID